MSIIVSNMNTPPGCQKCKFFRKHLFGNGIDYSYSCILGAKDFPMPWIRQIEERASDCPIKPSEQEPVLDKIRAEIEKHCGLIKENHCRYCSRCLCLMGVREILEVIDKYKAEGSDKE